jgi:hypothetical protein
MRDLEKISKLYYLPRLDLNKSTKDSKDLYLNMPKSPGKNL